MKLDKKLRTLQHMDDADAGALMEQYPPDWDQERVFRKAYAQYRSMQESGAEGVDAAVSATEPARERPVSRMLLYGSFAMAAAVCIGVFAGLVHLAKLPPPDDLHKQELTETGTSSTQATTIPTEQTTPQTSVQTSPSTHPNAADPPAFTVTSVTTVQASTTTVTTTVLPESTTLSPETTALPPETEAPVPTEPVTEVQPSETAPPEPEPPQVSGHFEVLEPDASGMSTLRYVPDMSEPVTELVHTFEAEGFTILSRETFNTQHDYWSVMFQIRDDDGQHYLVQQFRYPSMYGMEYHTKQFDANYYLTKEYDLGGKPAFLLYRDDPDSVCTLIWDDGCHICEMNSQVKDLAKMELLANSQTIQSEEE